MEKLHKDPKQSCIYHLGVLERSLQRYETKHMFSSAVLSVDHYGASNARGLLMGSSRETRDAPKHFTDSSHHQKIIWMQMSIRLKLRNLSVGFVLFLTFCFIC